MRDRDRPLQTRTGILIGAAGFGLQALLWVALNRFAAWLGLPVSGGGLAVAWMIGGQLVFTLLHQAAHVFTARSLGLNLREVNAGPFTLLWQPDARWAFRMDWHRIILTHGYMKAVPATTRNLRANWILLTGSGPAMSLLVAALGLLLLVSVPGTAAAAYSHLILLVTTFSAADCLSNLVPVGSSDGATILHTAAGSQRGLAILSGLEAGIAIPSLKVAEEVAATGVPAPEEAARPEVAGAVDERLDEAEDALREENGEGAKEMLKAAGELLKSVPSAGNDLWFRYWSLAGVWESAGMQHGAASQARLLALQFAQAAEEDDVLPARRATIRLEAARLAMAEGDLTQSAVWIQRADAAGRGLAPDANTVGLLVLRAECKLRAGEEAAALSAIECALTVADGLPKGQRMASLEVIGQLGSRASAAGRSAFAQWLFAEVVGRLEKSGPPDLSGIYRALWAEALYLDGKLAESQTTLGGVDAAAGRLFLHIGTLRGQLLLAEDRPQEATEVLTSLLAEENADPTIRRQLALASVRALRSWALYRSGGEEEAMMDARTACDVLMPLEHPDAAPALLTLAVAIENQNSSLAEAYLQEGTRLICESPVYLHGTKVARLTDLARGVVQARRVAWGKRLLERAEQLRVERAAG